MKQWVGIFLGFVVVVALVLAYMYRSSNFEVAPLSVTTNAPSAGVIAAPEQQPAPMAAPEQQQPAPMAAPEPEMGDEPMAMFASDRVTSTPVPPSMAPPMSEQPTAPSFGVSNFEPMPTDGEFAPAYENEYAEIEN